MSTRPALRSLLQGLVDDAAVFPPGNAPVEQAWSEHLALRSGRYGDLLGPLLIGTSGAASLVEVATGSEPPVADQETGGEVSSQVRVAVVARAGTPVEELLEAVARLREAPRLRVASVELVHDEDGRWRRALELDLPVAVEIGRDPAAQVRAMDDLVTEAQRHRDVVVKLRTQSTPEAAVPTPRELADFLDGVRRHALPFKLTGGLHHAVAGEAPRPDGAGTEFQHGVLNILVATHYLAGRDLPLPSLEAVLELEDAEGLAAIVHSLEDHEVTALRERFVSFGCCCVTDPLDELTELGVLPR